MEDRETTPKAPTPLDDDPLDNAPSDDGSGETHSLDATDLTLGGYLEVHERPPAFAGLDGQPYTSSVEIESVENLAAPYVAYLIFPRWAETGLGIVGHVETPVLYEGRSRDEVQDRVHALPLPEIKRLLDEAIRSRAEATDR